MMRYPTYEFITLSMANEIATLTLNRPDKRNAMHGPMIKEILQALAHLEKSTAGVLILNGAGTHFCAGADIAWMKKIASATRAENIHDAEQLATLMYTVHNFSKPTIVLAHGAVLGGGMGLLAAADIAVATAEATFGFPEVKMGIAPSVISPYVLNVIGKRATQYYFLSGMRFSAEKALTLNLLQEIVSTNEALLPRGIALANSLRQNGPLALTAVKKLIHLVEHEKINSQLLQKTAAHIANLRASDEAQEGLQAFMEKTRASLDNIKKFSNFSLLKFKDEKNVKL